MENKNNKESYGTNVCTVLTIVFVVLKLCKLIDWPWVWVLSPLWIGLIIAIVVCITVCLVVKWKE